MYHFKWEMKHFFHRSALTLDSLGLCFKGIGTPCVHAYSNEGASIMEYMAKYMIPGSSYILFTEYHKKTFPAFHIIRAMHMAFELCEHQPAAHWTEAISMFIYFIELLNTRHWNCIFTFFSILLSRSERGTTTDIRLHLPLTKSGCWIDETERES